VFHVAFDGFDQVRNEVVTACQLDIDLGKAVFDAISEVDKFIIDGDRIHDECANYREEYQK
jgi:hypothetical protein